MNIDAPPKESGCMQFTPKPMGSDNCKCGHTLYQHYMCGDSRESACLVCRKLAATPAPETSPAERPEQTHTALPWDFDADDLSIYQLETLEPITGALYEIDNQNTRANAEFIVQACNGYAEMQQENKRLQEKIAKLRLAFVLSDAVLPAEFEPELPPTKRLHVYIERKETELTTLRTACNNYDALRDSHKALVGALEKRVPKRPCKVPVGHEEAHLLLCSDCRDREALANAKQLTEGL